MCVLTSPIGDVPQVEAYDISGRVAVVFPTTAGMKYADSNTCREWTNQSTAISTGGQLRIMGLVTFNLPY